MKIRFWLTILPPGSGLYGGGELWYRDVTSGALPDRDDWVYTWVDDSDDGDGACSGFRLTPRRRYMDAHGGWNVELQRVAVDPSASEVQQIQAQMPHAGGRDEYDIHWTNSDGPLEQVREKLLATGWVKW